MSSKRLAAALATLLLAAASARPAEEPAEISLDDARAQISAIQTRVTVAENDRALLELREKALALQVKLQETSTNLEPRVAGLAARVAELGARPPGESESSDVATQRKELEQQRTSLEGQLKLARVLSLEIDQAVSQIAARSRERFRERLSDRMSSPLGRAFWADLSAEFPQDVQHARAFASGVEDVLRSASAGSLAVALLITLITLLARWRLTALLLSVAVPGRLRRSLRALAYIALWTVSVAIISASLLVPVGFAGLLAGAAGTVTFGVYVASLGAALLSVRAPTWRLPPVEDDVARTLRTFSTQLAFVIVMVALVEQLAIAIDLSLSASVALELLMTLVLSTTLARGLRRGVQVQARTQLPLWLTIVASIGWLMIAGSAACAVAGYVALGSFVVHELTWAVVVSCSAYLAAAVVDDALKALLQLIGARKHTVVLLSALVKLTIGAFAVVLLLAPYAPGAVDLVPQLHRVQQGVSIGAVRLRPGAIARGMAVLLLGFAAVKLLKQWTVKRYLPVTQLDEGMRQSISALVGYVGYVVVIAIALSATGVGLEQIAWVASALALGIGFGLQTIVQNFVSGLILLAERPVKVGDWVVLGEIAGDIRRIKARATEIQSIDRSTVIVPNSELITKVVRNITFANPLGVVQIKLPVPLGTDVERVQAELLGAFRRHPDILDTPEARVMLEGIEDGSVLFNATAYVASPRAAYRVRSAILFQALARLNEANITMVRPPAVVVRAGAQGE